MSGDFSPSDIINVISSVNSVMEVCVFVAHMLSMGDLVVQVSIRQFVPLFIWLCTYVHHSDNLATTLNEVYRL